MKIAIAGAGYIGSSNVALLVQPNEMVALDVFEEKIALLNSKKSPIIDVETEGLLQNKQLNYTIISTR